MIIIHRLEGKTGSIFVFLLSNFGRVFRLFRAILEGELRWGDWIPATHGFSALRTIPETQVKIHSADLFIIPINAAAQLNCMDINYAFPRISNTFFCLFLLCSGCPWSLGRLLIAPERLTYSRPLLERHYRVFLNFLQAPSCAGLINQQYFYSFEQNSFLFSHSMVVLWFLAYSSQLYIMWVGCKLVQY